MTLARQNVDKLRDIVSAASFGAVADNATNNTSAVQAAINSLPAVGGQVHIPDGCQFNLKSLTFPARLIMDYRIDDDLSRTTLPATVPASGERVFFHATSSYPANLTGGIVNERRFTAPFHPGYVLDVRKDVTAEDPYLGPGQSRTSIVRASYNIFDEGLGQWKILYEKHNDNNIFSGMYTTVSRQVVTLNGIGTASFSSVPAVNTVITGTTSGAQGFVLSVGASATTVIWFKGKFQVGETVADNNETSTTSITSAPITETLGQWLAQDFTKGNISIGLPPGAPTHTFAVGGKIAATITRSAGQHIPTAVTDPAYVWVDNYEAVSPAGLEIVYNATQPVAAARRLFLRNLGSSTNRGHVGAIVAHGQFNDAGLVATSKYNIDSVTKNGTGDYSINLSAAVARADYCVVVTLSDPLQYAYLFTQTTSIARIKVVTTGTSTPVDLSGNANVIMAGGDI